MKRLKKIMETAALIAILLWVISLVPFSRKIEQEIPAAIYQNGAAIGSTSVSISGKRTKHLFHDVFFEGTFAIHSIEKTEQEGFQAYIQWTNKVKNTQRIFYHSPGDIHNDIVAPYFIINPEMTQFAVSAKDGSVIATSDKVYEIYAAHIAYDPERNSMSINGIIPDF